MINDGELPEELPQESYVAPFPREHLSGGSSGMPSSGMPSSGMPSSIPSFKPMVERVLGNSEEQIENSRRLLALWSSCLSRVFENNPVPLYPYDPKTRLPVPPYFIYQVAMSVPLHSLDNLTQILIKHPDILQTAYQEVKNGNFSSSSAALVNLFKQYINFRDGQWVPQVLVVSSPATYQRARELVGIKNVEIPSTPIDTKLDLLYLEADSWPALTSFLAHNPKFPMRVMNQELEMLGPIPIIRFREILAEPKISSAAKSVLLVEAVEQFNQEMNQEPEIIQKGGNDNNLDNLFMFLI